MRLLCSLTTLVLNQKTFDKKLLIPVNSQRVANSIVTLNKTSEYFPNAFMKCL